MQERIQFADTHTSVEGLTPFTPLVSVVIPTYNRKTLLLEAIDSVIKQEMGDQCEIIVVDDGYEDDTIENLQSLELPRLTIVQTKHVGCGCARNAGIEVAKGQYIAFLDSDDLLCPGSIKKRVEYLDAHPEIPMVFTDEFMEFEGKPSEKTKFGLQYTNTRTKQYYFKPNFIQPQTPIQFSAVMARASFFDEVGRFDERLRGHEDSEFCHRIAGIGYKMGFIEEPLTVFRWGKDPEHSLKIANHDDFIEIGKEYLKIYHERRGERGLTTEEEKWIRESYAKLEQLSKVFDLWKLGVLSDHEFHRERQAIFEWAEYE